MLLGICSAGLLDKCITTLKLDPQCLTLHTMMSMRLSFPHEQLHAGQQPCVQRCVNRRCLSLPCAVQCLQHAQTFRTSWHKSTGAADLAPCSW